MSARTWHVVWIAGLVLVAVVWAQSSTASQPEDLVHGLDLGSPTLTRPATQVSTARAEAETPSVVVHVSGAVARPGVVQLSAPSRIADVVRASGGLLPTADMAAVNLAAPVGDGEHVHIPALGEATPGLPRPSAGRDAAVAISLNQATVEDLQALPGVGPVLAQRIADYREANGPFAVVEDLLDVPGIGEGRLAELRKSITVP